MEAVADWYLRSYFRRDHEPGSAAMFYDRAMVGHFAVNRSEIRRGEGRALFRLLIATSLFQRLRDQHVLNILRGIGAREAQELTDSGRLVTLAQNTGCAASASVQGLVDVCDLTKEAGVGICNYGNQLRCHLKTHSEVLKRYGHFGKVPTSSALMVHEAGYQDLGQLLEALSSESGTRESRALSMEAQLSIGWRISQKIAAMFLSMLVDPDIAVELVPWAHHVASDHFVVIDSNVDLFLTSIDYRGMGTYDARRAFIQALARKIDLRRLDRRVQRSYSPRLLQQAAYVFMGASNRRETEHDCSRMAPSSCAACPRNLRDRCSLGRTA
jgi:hypothetical protein